MNIKVVLEYDGSEFSGWQSQRDRRTVEAELQRALLLVTGTSPVITAAGRTDAGAHARGQVVNFRLERIQEPRRLLAALNAVLPQDIAAVSAEAVGDDFHARYSARLRRYRYRFLDRWPRPAIDRGYCWHVRRRLDVAAMDAAAAALTGEHDWTSFCVSAEPPSGRVRVMEAARVSRAGDFVELELVGQGFLRGLARGIAGALVEVGWGNRPPQWVGELLESRDRGLCPRAAPARGLTLMEVIYRTDPGSA